MSGLPNRASRCSKGAHVRDLITLVPTMQDVFEANIERPLPPFHSDTSQQALDWVRDEARHIVFVYGEWDPWSGGMVPVPTDESSGRFLTPRAGHWAALSLLDSSERDRALALVEAMFGQVAQRDSYRARGDRGSSSPSLDCAAPQRATLSVAGAAHALFERAIEANVGAYP